MNEQQKKVPYTFDVIREYRIYKNIGIKHRLDSFKSIKQHKIKKAEKNHEEIFEVFSEWENYFISNYCSNGNQKDFIHYLNEKMIICEMILKICEVLYVPIVLAEITYMLSDFFDYSTSLFQWVIAIAVLIVTVILTIVGMARYNGRKEFYSKCIQIIRKTEQAEN